MLTKRVIACLDVRDGRVVKGVQFVDLMDAGDPAEMAALHAREGADEIVLLDITATHEGRGTLLETVRTNGPGTVHSIHCWWGNPQRGGCRRRV